MQMFKGTHLVDDHKPLMALLSIYDRRIRKSSISTKNPDFVVPQRERNKLISELYKLTSLKRRILEGAQ